MDDILKDAIAHHQQGRVGEALALYEQILQTIPNPPEQHQVEHLAGMAYFALGDLERAEHYLGLAAAGANRGDYFFGHGNVLHALKRYGEAYDAFQKAVALDPGNAALWFNLANSARFVDAPRAVMAYTQALSLDPNLIKAFVPLAALLLDAGDLTGYAQLLRRAYTTPAAEEIFSEPMLLGARQAVFAESNASVRDVLATFPKNYAAHPPGANRAFAIILELAGDEAAAIECLQAAAKDDPDADKIVRLVKNYLGLGERYGSDLILFDLLLKVYPQSKRVINAALLFALGMENRVKAVELLQAANAGSFAGLVTTEVLLESATKYLFAALKEEADVVESYIFLSRILEGHNKIPDAMHVARAAQELAPQNMAANLQLARMAHRFDLDTAEEELQKALSLNPESADLLNYMGNIKMRRGDMASAVDYYARARAHIGPDQGEKYELQLLSTLFTGDIPAQLAGDMHKAWGDALIARQKFHRLTHDGLAAKPRLRIGYLSADFYDSSPAYFLLPLLENHDPEKVEIFFYCSLDRPDLATKRIQRLGKWRDISNLSDSEAIELIRKDDIDILVDLLGQTQGARHVIFARKAAPVQVTWLGYATTSGLSTIDYRFTDAIADPPGMTESYHAEQLYRLPHFLCYQPPIRTPDVTRVPAFEIGSITFGCFNQAMKITDEAIAAWAKIMHRVENSRLIVKAAEFGDPKTLESFREKFSSENIEAERILYYNRTNFKFDHLTVYSEVDIALDPFPFNGTTTTFETLWMGVPMVTLEGKAHAARVGCAILEPLGLNELIACSVEEYINKAVALAHDLPRLAVYRSGMRERLQKSPLMDGKAFAASVEEAYERMWIKAVSQSMA